MEVAFGGFVEDSLGEGGRSFGCRGSDGPEEDVELRRECWDEEVGGFAKALVEFEGGGVAGFESLREGAAGGVGEQLLRGPEGDGRGSGTGTLEGDFAEVEVVRGEIGVGGVVFVETADGGVAEEDAAAAVGLEAVLVRIDDDGLGVGDGVECGSGFRGQIGGEDEVATIGSIDVDAEFVFFPEHNNLVERIDGADGGCA